MTGAEHIDREASHLWDLNLQTAILIAAPPSTIWPWLLEPNRWKSGPRLVRIGGPLAAVGERFKAVRAGGQGDVAFLVETIAHRTGTIWTTRLTDNEGKVLGFAEWTLAPAAGGTTVTYDLFCRIIAPSDGGEEARLDYRAALTARLQDELAELRLLVESGTR